MIYTESALLCFSHFYLASAMCCDNKLRATSVLAHKNPLKAMNFITQIPLGGRIVKATLRKLLVL